MGETFSSAFWRAGNLMQRKKEREEGARQFDARHDLNERQYETYEDYTQAQQDKWVKDAKRQKQQDIWDKSEQIFTQTGDPDQALGYLNKELGTEYKYGGSQDDWIKINSKEDGTVMFNWRTKETEVLVEPTRQPPKMQSYDQGDKRVTEWRDEAGKVTKRVEAPRWQPKTPESAKPKDPVQNLVRAHNANLKAVASEVAVYLKPEERAALANLPDNSPEYMAVFWSAVQKSGLPTDVKFATIQRLKQINDEFTRLLNTEVGANIPPAKPYNSPPPPSPKPEPKSRSTKSSWREGREDLVPGKQEKEKKSNRKVIKKGTYQGRRVVEYEDGTVEYAD